MEEYTEEKRTSIGTKNVLTFGQAVLTIIAFIFVIGVTWGTNALRISVNEEEIKSLKTVKDAETLQLNRMEHNLRNLCTQQKLNYEDFGK
jgi:hypothetical protein